MQISQMLHKLLRARRNKDIFIFVLFFVFAAIIWYGHAMQSVRTTSVPIYIHYIGKPANIGLGEEGLPNKLMIDVRDAGHRLAAYHENPLRITIDLHQYIHGDSGTIQIPSNALRASIKGALQANSNLLGTEPEEIRCSYFREHEKNVRLMLDADIQLASGYQIIGKPQLKQQKITIYGKQDVLQEIDTIRTQHLAFTNLSDTLRTQVALDLPKGIRAERDSVYLELFIEQFTEKRYKMQIEKRNVPSGWNLHIFPEDVEVCVRIGMSHFADLKDSDLKVYCICPSYPTGEKKLDVTFDYSANPYITSAWIYPAQVEFLVEQ